MTMNEFQSKIWSKYPNHVITFEQDPLTNKMILYASATSIATLPTLDKEILSTHILEDGKIVKDRDGLFAQVQIVNNTSGPVTITAPTSSSGNFTFYVNGVPIKPIHDPQVSLDRIVLEDPPQDPKCECGSRAVGSNRHSSWCPIKE